MMRIVAGWSTETAGSAPATVDHSGNRAGIQGNKRPYAMAKRACDVIISATALLCFLPFLVLAWGIVRLTSKGPGIFWSERVGLGGRPFMMPKLRTMTVDSRVVSREVAGDSEVTITPFGAFLRKTSIDELPQLWSVLMGDMSLIGPRALIPNDIAIEERKKYREIFMLRPGISGLAQIKGRNFVTPRKKALYDRFYADRANIGVDFWIIFETVKILWNTKLVK